MNNTIIVGMFSIPKVRKILKTAQQHSDLEYQEENAFPDWAFHLSGSKDELIIVSKALDRFTKY
jgi:hypothetical protein